MRPEAFVLTVLVACAEAPVDDSSVETGTPVPVQTAATGDTGPAEPTCPISTELGTGVNAFASLEDGDELVMVYGPQGGYHLPLALRGCSVGPQLQTTLRGTVVDTGQVVVQILLPHAWTATDECCGTLLDVFGYLFSVDPDWSPLDLDGVAVDLFMEQTDGTTTVEDTVRVMVRAPDESA